MKLDKLSMSSMKLDKLSMKLDKLSMSSMKPRCLFRKLEVPLPLGLTHRITLRLLWLAELLA